MNSTVIDGRPLTPTELEDIALGRRNPRPRIATLAEKDKLEEFLDSIRYSSRYNDDEMQYRHVELPKQMLKQIPKDYFRKDSGVLKLLWEEEWRGLGITQSLGWIHYEVHEPEPHILLFRRPLVDQTPLTAISNNSEQAMSANNEQAMKNGEQAMMA